MYHLWNYTNEGSIWKLSDYYKDSIGLTRYTFYVSNLQFESLDKLINTQKINDHFSGLNRKKIQITNPNRQHLNQLNFEKIMSKSKEITRLSTCGQSSGTWTNRCYALAIKLPIIDDFESWTRSALHFRQMHIFMRRFWRRNVHVFAEHNRPLCEYPITTITYSDLIRLYGHVEGICSRS